MVYLTFVQEVADRGVPHFNALTKNIRINFTSSETRMIVVPGAENRTIVVSSFIWKKTPECDGRTDRIPLASTIQSLVFTAHLVRIDRNADTVLARGIPSVQLSVCPSVTFQCFLHLRGSLCLFTNSPPPPVKC